jgi:hypothetical protein
MDLGGGVVTMPTSTLLDQARAEHAAREEAEAAAGAAEQKARLDALRGAVRGAVTAALVRLDGTAPTWAETGLRFKANDVDGQWAVVSDEGGEGVVEPVWLLVQRQDDGGWSVRVTWWDETRWELRGPRVRSLADVGAALPPEPA